MILQHAGDSRKPSKLARETQNLIKNHQSPEPKITQIQTERQQTSSIGLKIRITGPKTTKKGQNIENQPFEQNQ